MSFFTSWLRTRLTLLPIAAACLASSTAPVRGDSGPTDIVDTVVSSGGFDTLVAAVEAADLVPALQGRGPFTVFAPNDAAFKRLPAKTLKTLLKPENKERLQAVLTYHVVPGLVTARDAYGASSVATLNGQRIEIESRDGKLVIGKAKIVATDISCTNGVIHVIDRVLMPEQKVSWK